MKAIMLIEGQPFGKLVNQVRTEVTFGQFDEIETQDFVELFVNFVHQIGLDVELVKDLILEYNEEGEKEEGIEDEETPHDIANFLQEKINDRHEDIEKIVSQEENRKKFLEQISNNKEMLIETFRLYLQDTLELYTDGQ